MERFSSLRHAPAETRLVLRDRFCQLLGQRGTKFLRALRPNQVSDEALLQLLSGLLVDRGASVDNARAALERAANGVPEAPSFEGLVESGWIRVAWGRISTFMIVGGPFANAPSPLKQILEAAFASRYDEKFGVSGVYGNVSELEEARSQIDQGTFDSRTIGSPSPEWVAARLWDREERSPESDVLRLRSWVDRWNMLMWPNITPGFVWSESFAARFRSAALEVLRSDRGLLGWSDVRARMVNQICAMTGHASDHMERVIHPVPTTLVGRYAWLKTRSLEHVMNWAAHSNADLISLVRLLLMDVREDDHGPAPHLMSKLLLELAVEKPDLLDGLTQITQQFPELLADLSMHAATSALACMLVALRPLPGSAWEPQLVRGDAKASQLTAFSDAVAVMAHNLRAGHLAPPEATALLLWIHSQSVAYELGDDSGNHFDLMLMALKRELEHQNPSVLKFMLEPLAGELLVKGFGTAEFNAAIDLISIAGMSEEVAPDLYVSAYVTTIQKCTHFMSARRTDVIAATILAKLAARASPELRASFYTPIDVRKVMAEAAADDVSGYRKELELIASLRTHIRVLSRAISGFGSTPSDELVSGLAAAIYSGAVDQREQGRISVFVPPIVINAFRAKPERPIALDLAFALRALSRVQQDRILAELLESNEPTMLAQLLEVAPPTSSCLD